MTGEERVWQALQAHHAILRDRHFRLYSGLHSSAYVHVRLALAHDEFAREMGKRIGSRFLNGETDVVVGFTIGGIILAENVARFLGSRTVVARIMDGGALFVGGTQIKSGENVIIVDDVLRPPSGEAIYQVLVKIRDELQGNIQGVGVIVDRSTEEPSFAQERTKLVKLTSADIAEFPTYPPDSCPLCKQAIPLEDLSRVDTDPLLLLFSLPKEEDRTALAALLRHVFESYWEDRALLREVDSHYDPEREFPGRKWERVAVLGATEAGGSYIMDDIANSVASLGFYAITSRCIYQKDTAEKREITHFEREGMNDFLQRMIHSCQYAIIVHALSGGQLIEAVWCNQCGKPTLGYVPLRNLSSESFRACDYLQYDKGKELFVCRGYRAIEEGRDEVGGWICGKNDKCPFLSQNITKMVLDLHMNGKMMFLVGSERKGGFIQPVRNFLQNKGILKM